MAFDNLNYSTENMDDNSIQDRIDELSAGVRTNLAALKQETLITSLESGRVDIRDAGSFLYFRDRNGGEIGRLDDNTTLTILDDHIFGRDSKVFLHVRLGDGRTGYVSADYIKADLTNDGITNRPEGPTEGGVEGPEGPTEGGVEGPEGPTEVRPEGPTEGGSEEPIIIEDAEIIPHAPRAGFRNGQPYLIAPDGTIETHDLPEVPNLGITHPGLTEYLMIWTSKAQQEANGIFGRYFRDDDEIISEQVGNVFSKLIELEIAINQNPRNSNNENDILNEIFDFILIAEGQEAIISNHREIHTLLLDDSLSPERKRLRIYHLSREGILDHGNANEVQNLLADELMQEEFENIQTVLDSEVFLQAVINGDTNTAAGFIESTGIDSESAQNLAEKYTEKADSIGHRLSSPGNIDQFRADLTETNRQRTQQGLPALLIDDIVSQQRDIAVIELMRHSLLRANIAMLDDRGDVEHSLTGMYAGVSGLSRENSFYLGDAFNISDGNINNAIDVSVFAATTILTMGAGAVAIGGARLAVAAGSRALAGARFANSSNRAIRGLQYTVNGGGRSMSTIRAAAAIGTEGVLFYEGMNLAQNMISENEMSNFLDGWDDTEGITKSIYMVGVFRMFSYLRAGGQLGRLGNVYDRIPNSTLRQAALILSEGAAIYGGEEILLNGFVFDEGISFTWSELIQTIALVGILRGAGPAYNSARQRIISRNRNGEIVLLESPTASALRRAGTASGEAIPINILPTATLNRLQGQSFTTNINRIRTTTTFEGPSRITFRSEAGTQGRFGARDKPNGLAQTLQREGVELFIYTGRGVNSGRIFTRRNNQFYDNQGNLVPNANISNLQAITSAAPSVTPAPVLSANSRVSPAPRPTPNPAPNPTSSPVPRISASARQPVDRAVITKNRRLNEPQRLEEANRLLGTRLSGEQRTALMLAHNTRGIRAKINILSTNGANGQPLFNITQRGLLMRNGITGRPPQLNPNPSQQVPQSPQSNSPIFSSQQFGDFMRRKNVQDTIAGRLNTGTGSSLLAKPISIPLNLVNNVTRFFINHPTQIVQNIRNAPGIPASVKEAVLSVFVSPSHANQSFIRNMMSFALTGVVPVGVTVLDEVITGDLDNINGFDSVGADIAENFFMYNVLGWRIALGKELYEQGIFGILGDVSDAYEAGAQGS